MKNENGLERLASNSIKCFSSLFAASTLGLSVLADNSPVITSMELSSPDRGIITNQGYFVTNMPDQTRLYKDGYHFMTVITNAGRYAIRPHPGEDNDGWSGTFYFQPRLSNANITNADKVEFNVVTNNGVPEVEVKAQGKVPSGVNSTYGSWTNLIDFRFDRETNKISGHGTYHISLKDTNIPSDLYFFDLHNNILLNVPKLDGSVGNSGDVSVVDYMGDMFPISYEPPYYPQWYPTNSNGHFPNDNNSFVLAITEGNFNDVDTVRQSPGFRSIKAAYKPSISVRINDITSPQKIRFGVWYDMAQSATFNSDNLKVTPWINKANVKTNDDLTIEFTSEPIPGDRYFNEINLEGSGTRGATQGIYYTFELNEPLKRVGTMNDNRNGSFSCTVKVDPKLQKGFFRTIAE